jgi:hypothetical protein
MTDTRTQALVTQADRDAAADWTFIECMRCSEYEGDFGADLAADFAAHRIAALDGLNPDAIADVVAALREIEQSASIAIGAIDKYNEQNDTDLCGGGLFRLASSIGAARTAIKKLEAQS